MKSFTLGVDQFVGSVSLARSRLMNIYKMVNKQIELQRLIHERKNLRSHFRLKKDQTLLPKFIRAADKDLVRSFYAQNCYTV